MNHIVTSMLLLRLLYCLHNNISFDDFLVFLVAIRDICVRGLVKHNLPGYVRSSEYVHFNLNIRHLVCRNLKAYVYTFLF